MFIDVHCHLDDKTYGDVGSVIEASAQAGVKMLVNAGFDVPSSLYGRQLSEKYDGVWFTAGLHPTELDGYKKEWQNEVYNLLSHPKCVAVGEIGLDYHYPQTDKALQREVFLDQLSMAHERHMPVEIHSRDCAEDMLGILKANKSLIGDGALMHCYSHSPEIAAELLRLGMYFSFGGASTWKGSKRAARTIAMLPADRIMTETDSPYMPPASAYGSFPNTPAAIPEIAAHIALIKGISAGQFEEIALSNAKKFFPKLS